MWHPSPHPLPWHQPGKAAEGSGNYIPSTVVLFFGAGPTSLWYIRPTSAPLRIPPPFDQLAPDLLKLPKSRPEPARILETLGLWPALQPPTWTRLSPAPACAELTPRPCRRLPAFHSTSSTQGAPGLLARESAQPASPRSHEVIVSDSSRKARLGLGVPLKERSSDTGVGLKSSGFKLSGLPESRGALLRVLQQEPNLNPRRAAFFPTSARSFLRSSMLRTSR